MSRRAFVQHGAAALGGGALLTGRPSSSLDWTRSIDRTSALAERIDPGLVHRLALQAIESARAAGATYADVRLTRTVHQRIEFDSRVTFGANVTDDEIYGVGVRALVDGYWGFAASPYWEPEEMTRLAREAVAQGHANAGGIARRVELGRITPATGSWVMPGIDPFTVSIEERIDFLNGVRIVSSEMANDRTKSGLVQEILSFERQERVFASTEGAYTNQTTYATLGSLAVLVAPTTSDREPIRLTATGLHRQGKGWEMFREAKLYDQLAPLFERGADLLVRPQRPGEVGRYDVVLDAATVAGLVAQTIGTPTELDRVMGFEVNGGGSSYLSGTDIMSTLGSFAIGNPLLSVRADRSAPGGAATVKWDDEGVPPEDFSIIDRGVIVDCQTTREQASWLAPYYARKKAPSRSHGCASAPHAQCMQMQHTPNLTVTPGTNTSSFSDLVAGTERGIAVMAGNTWLDFQGRNGLCGGLMMEIVKGKLGAVLGGIGLSFKTTELWKQLTAIGGAASVEHFGDESRKGQPSQAMPFSVASVPVACSGLAVVRE